MPRTRQQSDAERDAVARGLDAFARGPAEVILLMRVLHDEARRAIDEKSVAPLMDFLYANMEQAQARLANVAIACRAGCSHCCHGFVAATAPEVLFVARQLEHAAQARIAALAAATAGKSPAERERMVTPCALLENDLCTVYTMRPIACRTAVSTDAEICRRAHIGLSGEPIPKPTAYSALRRAYYVAFAGALRRAGLVWRPYEYNSALNHALTVPGAEADWLAGRDIFDGLPEDIGGDVFADPVIAQVYDAAFGS